MRLPGLLVIVSLMAVAIGIEGALEQRALAIVLTDAIWMLVAVEASYVAASLLWTSEASPAEPRKA
ncbi:hypothetical protein ASF41_15775 [Methylobacterium sp. Leaf111]|nr:hypothetical protein ASF41_15775 [Methylobacterium sp. Leaf111]